MAGELKAKSIPVIGSLIMSGHCSFPVTNDPFQSHERCARNGGGSRANPQKVFTPCPCPCHYGEEFECGGCGRPIREALCWPFDEDGDMRYTHVDADGRATGEDCSGAPVSRNPEPEEEEEPDIEEEEPEMFRCSRCDALFTGNSGNPECPRCTAGDGKEAGLHLCGGCGLELDGDDPSTFCEDCAAEEVLPPRLGLTPEEQFERSVPKPNEEDEWDDLLSEFDLDDD